MSIVPVSDLGSDEHPYILLYIAHIVRDGAMCCCYVVLMQTYIFIFLFPKKFGTIFV